VIATRGTFIAAAGAALAVPHAAAAADPVTVSVGIPPGTMGAIVEYAKERGFFKAAGLDVRPSILNSGAIVATAVTGGSFDFGAVNVGSLASARLPGLPLRIIAPAALIPAGRYGETVVVHKDSPIRNAADLDGKTVGIVALKTVQHAAFLAWLDKRGGDPKSVKMFEMPLPNMGAMLESSRIDAAIMVDPFTTKSLAANRTLGPNLYEAIPLPVLCYAICAAEPWLAANAETAVRFASAIHAAAVWANGHGKECRSVLAATMSLEPSVADTIYLPLMGTNLDPSRITPVIDVLVKYGFLDKALAPSDMIWRPPA